LHILTKATHCPSIIRDAFGRSLTFQIFMTIDGRARAAVDGLDDPGVALRKGPTDGIDCL
jgi:hypothetical protein